MSVSKRQKVNADSLEFTVSIKGHGLIDIPIDQFIDRESIAKIAEVHLAKIEVQTLEQHKRVLQLVRTVFPQAKKVDWEEDGGLEDIAIAHYFYGSRYNLEEEFDMNYSVDIFIPFSASDRFDEWESGIGLSFDASLSADCGDDKVLFEFKRRKLCLYITNWQTGEINPPPEQVREMLLKLIEEEIDVLEASYIIEDLKQIDMVKVMNACPRFHERE